MIPRLSSEDRAKELPALAANGWQAVPGRDALRKVWRFTGFSAAWGFMSRAALTAEQMDHHPEWTNRYDIVDVTLTTHDCGGLSALDVRMAHALDRLAEGGTALTQGDAPILTRCEDRAARR